MFEEVGKARAPLDLARRTDVKGHRHRGQWVRFVDVENHIEPVRELIPLEIDREGVVGGGPVARAGRNQQGEQNSRQPGVKSRDDTEGSEAPGRQGGRSW